MTKRHLRENILDVSRTEDFFHPFVDDVVEMMDSEFKKSLFRLEEPSPDASVTMPYKMPAPGYRSEEH